MALEDAGLTGLGLTPSAHDINRCFTRLKDMLDQWQRMRWLIWHLVPTDIPMTGARSYTVGLGGQFNVARPDRLEAARIMQNNPPVPDQVGWPLEIVQSMEAYNNIRLQDLGSLPRYVFLDTDWPLARVFFWPLPSSAYTGRIITKQQFTALTNLSDVLDFPPEYNRAIRFNLQDELLSAYKLPPDEFLSARAAGALNVIKNANAQIPVLKLPAELVRNGIYNVLTDNTI
jgi:hypothetical protein